MVRPLVIQTDFGRGDGAVAAMYGVALSQAPGLQIYDLTHEIRPYHIVGGSWVLYQTVQFWPEGTVFISVVDPGVGSDRNSAAVRTKTGHFVITPNNGTLSHLAKFHGFDAIREIDVDRYIRKDMGASHTFHGRDLYARVGALLAAEKITLEEIGPELPLSKLVLFDIEKPKVSGNSIISHSNSMDTHFGSIWTDVPYEQAKGPLDLRYGEKIHVVIREKGLTRYDNFVVFARTFADVKEGEPLVFVNSLYALSIASNRFDFVNHDFLASSTQLEIEFSKISL
jgi:S-adenosylmethionine hydrolase